MNGDGQVWGLFTYGIIGPYVHVIVHHFQVLVNVRNWGIMYALIFLVSILQLPLVMYNAQKFTRSAVYMAITTELYATPLFWLIILLLAVTLSIPFLLSRVYRHVYKEPEVYAQEEIPDPCWEGGCLAKVEDQKSVKEERF